VPATWGQLAKRWLAKGYTHTDASDKLGEAFGEGFSRTTISILAKTRCEPCPPEVADLIEKLPVLDAKRWERYQREMASQPVADSEASPGSTAETVKEAVAKVGDTVRGWLDTAGSTLQAFATQGSALLSGLAARLDSNGAQIDAQNAKLDSTRDTLKDVNAKLDSTDARLDSMNAKLDSTGAKLDDVKRTATNTEAVAELINAKMDTREQRRRREHLHLMGAIFGMGLLLTCVLRKSTAPDAPVQSNVTVNVGTTQGGNAEAPSGWWGEALFPWGFGAKMGERKPAPAPRPQGPRMMPHKPLPGQAVEPCPGSSRVVFGSCWYLTGDKAPCPPDQFQEGQQCYVPVRMDPNEPGSETTRPPNPEQR